MYSGNVKLDYKGEYWIMIKKNEELDKLYNRNPENLVHITIEKAVESGTQAQNDAMHAVLGELFIFMMKNCSNPIMEINAFKDYMKLVLGFAYYRESPDRGTVAIPMRWSRMNKLQRSDFIDKLLVYVREVGADKEKKMQEILQGMSENAKINGYGG